MNIAVLLDIDKKCKAPLLLALPLLALLLTNGLADDELDEIRAANLEKNAAWFAQMQAIAETNTHWHTLPRILIDTTEPAIIFQAEATGLSAREIVEFFLIGERSGNAYEATAVALAQPGDIATAIEMLGLPKGLHPDPAALRFWPQGERVHLYLNEHHAADLMLDQRTGQPAPRTGFVFTSSHTTKRDGKEQLSAQVERPFSIAANYNEPRSILDVPFRAPQAAVYSHQVQNPEIRFAPGELLTVRIVPERTDGSKRVQTMQLTVSHASPSSAPPAADLRFHLTQANEPTQQPLLDNAPVERLLMTIHDIVEANQDPFVEIHYQAELPLLHAHSMARLVEAMEDNHGLRVLPPPPGTLFYRAFNPNEEQRNRAERFAHPWELHLSPASDTPPQLIQITEEWTQGKARPDITIEEIAVTKPEQLSKIMTDRRPGMNAVFIYAPREMRIGAIMDVVRHFQKTHPLIHVFMTPPLHDQTFGATPAATSE